MRRDPLRQHHVLGDALAHHAHRLHLVTAEIDALARHGRLEDGVRPGAARGRVRWTGGRGAGRDGGQKILLLMRPPVPVPRTVARSMFFSRASRRTRGELRIVLASPLVATATEPALGAASTVDSGACF